MVDGCRGRKRIRSADSWARNIAKRSRNTGKSFINHRGVKRQGRCLKKGCGVKCRFKCHSKLSTELREDIFHNFWGLGDITCQRQFILKYSAPKGKLGYFEHQRADGANSLQEVSSSSRCLSA